mgnify:CR=1 FL=1
MLHLGGYARGALYAVRAQHNGHERVRRPTPSGGHIFLRQSGQHDAASRCVLCTLIAYDFARALPRPTNHVLGADKSGQHGVYSGRLHIWEDNDDRFLFGDLR